MIQIETVSGGGAAAYALMNEMPMVLFENYLSTGTLSASTEASDGAKENIADESTADFWTPTALPAWIETDAGSAVTVDCAAIVAHTLGSEGATVEVQYYNGSGWTTVASVTPTDDEIILVLFGEETRQRWRFYITGTTVPSIGVGMIGQRFVFESNVVAPYTPIKMSEEIELLTSVTLGGNFLGNRVRRTGARTTVAFAPALATWVRGTLEPFRQHFNNGQPFVFASSPTFVPNDAAYCFRSDRAQPMNPTFAQDGLFMSFSMDVDAYAY